MTGVLVHEWIAPAGGSENVLAAFADLYPESDIVSLWDDSGGRFAPERVHETWLARTPLRRSKAAALPFMPGVWRKAPDRGYDWALVSSHLFAHHARFPGVAPADRFVYVHSPARYIWTPDLDRRGANAAIRAISAGLKPIDRRRAAESPSFAANSDFVRRRIEAAWHQPAVVIHPPVEVSRIRAVRDWADGLRAQDQDVLGRLPDRFVLGASRFIPYKQLDDVIRAGELIDLPVVLAGKGPEEAALRDRAGRASVDVAFVLAPSDALLYALYQRCSVFVFPPIEDFGIMPVEAMAAGAAVVANREGGAAESVVPGETGELADMRSDADLRSAVERALATERGDRVARADEFSVERFGERIRAWTGR